MSALGCAVPLSHPVLDAIHRAAFTPIGWFTPDAEEPGLPPGVRTLLLIGNAGSAMFERFAAERDPARDRLDDWTRERIDALARELGAHAVYPFDRPFPPMQRWARRAGGGQASPLGLDIHPVYGLWHAYRAALLFDTALDLPSVEAGSHPCESCAAKPCLRACPVAAFDGRTYDVDACVRHIAQPAGADCLAAGCRARHACPVGAAYAHTPAQARFHMRAFLAAHADGLH